MIVVDASVALTWISDDEKSEVADRVLVALDTERGIVPAILYLEVQNALLIAERAGRLAVRAQELIARIRAIELEVEVAPPFDTAIFDVAKKWKLSAYNASYLELALRRGCKLATLDKSLARAAEREGVLFS